MLGQIFGSNMVGDDDQFRSANYDIKDDDSYNMGQDMGLGMNAALTPNSYAQKQTNLSNHIDAENSLSMQNSQMNKHRATWDYDEISSLHEKKRNLFSFMESIGDLSGYPIREDILQHCEKLVARISIGLTKQGIIKITKNRVEKMIKNRRIKRNWGNEDVKILIWVISSYCRLQEISSVNNDLDQSDWQFIANLIPGVTPKSCLFKWLSLKKVNLAESSWVEQQSILLNLIVKKYGNSNWTAIAEQLYLKNRLPNKVFRCSKQCREHWNCYLNPCLKKGPWEKSEDFLLLKSVAELNGAKKWAQIVKMFNGRTENAIKNRFNLIIEKESREFKEKKRPTELEVVEHYLAKHQNNFEIEKQKLEFLNEQKENHLEGIIKKRVRNTNIAVNDDGDDYIPQEILARFEQPLKRKPPHPQKQEGYINSELSYENLIVHQLFQESIFDEDEENPHKSQLFRKEPHIHYVDQTSQNKLNQELMALEHQLSFRNSKNQAEMMPFNSDLLEQLKKQFDRNEHSFVPFIIESGAIEQ